MKDLLRSYGTGLTAFFFAAVALWATVLILLPQITMLERAITLPKRSLDSSIAGQLERDARTCISVLQAYTTVPDGQAPDAGQGDSGLAIPSPSTMAVPSPSTMAVPSASGMAVPSATSTAQGSSTRPYILQCDRATTRKALPRGGTQVFLNDEYGLPFMEVVDADPVERQSETASQIAEIAADLYQVLLAREAQTIGLTATNFSSLTQPILIPLSDTQRAIEDAKLEKQLLALAGLRFERDGQVYERIGLTILARTLMFAVMATLIALIACYPIAYKLALDTRPERFVLLFIALVIPYAIVELMRIYAWTAIIDNRGVLNTLFDALGLIDLDADGGIQFKRSAFTVFAVMVYTYMLFMLFPMVNVMTTLDRNQIEAARDLGAAPWRIHWRVIIPHTKPGIAVGCIATFMLTAGAFSVPRIISSGLQAEWFAQTIYNKFFESENSNVGAAYSFAYTLVCFIIVGLFMWATRTRLSDFARAR